MNLKKTRKYLSPIFHVTCRLHYYQILDQRDLFCLSLLPSHLSLYFYIYTNPNIITYPTQLTRTQQNGEENNDGSEEDATEVCN